MVCTDPLSLSWFDPTQTLKVEGSRLKEARVKTFKVARGKVGRINTAS